VKKLISSCAFALGLAMGVSACTDPYDPRQHAVGGGLLGAGTGAAIGGIAGGGRGAATGALIGGTLGAVGGATTTPSPDYYGYGSSGSGYNTTSPTDPNTTGVATMELATTDTANRNTELPTRRSPQEVLRAERLIKRLPTPPLSVAWRDEGARFLRLSSSSEPATV
jgi:hypothetical protein